MVRWWRGFIEILAADNRYNDEKSEIVLNAMDIRPLINMKFKPVDKVNNARIGKNDYRSYERDSELHDKTEVQRHAVHENLLEACKGSYAYGNCAQH